MTRHLRERVLNLDIFGLGGDHLAAQGAHLVAHVRDLAVVGLFEVLRHVRRLRGIMRSVLDEVDRDPPDLAVLVDYAGFNLRLGQRLHARGIRVAYYVSPQVWAWRRRRIRTIRDIVSRMMVIFPFEEPLYREAGVPVTFVGHPLVDLVEPLADPPEFLRSVGLDPSRPVVGILPGSRTQEVRFNLPPLAGAVRILAGQRPELQFAVAVAPGLDAGSFDQVLPALPVVRLKGQAHSLMGSATVGLVASGTATVEAALMELPMVVVYRLSPVTYALGRRFVNVPHYAMANLIAERRVVKELIQKDFTPETVATETRALLDNADARTALKNDLREVRSRLGARGASARAASIVADLMCE
jgi:lipid-A-disaccharide synthase